MWRVVIFISQQQQGRGVQATAATNHALHPLTRRPHASKNTVSLAPCKRISNL
jgi:hypothetical protein